MDNSPKKFSLWKIISVSSVGTLIEWYDFYIFGSLATIIAKQFFPEDAGTSALLSTLALFAAGFIVRPFGALVFGRLGDIIGRKYTFLLTLVLMGTSTFAMGLIPGYKTLGLAAPLIVLVLRLVQGLALGGQYGGAATYVAEHAPNNRRGFFTSWIQTTATLGLLLSIGVITITRKQLGVDAFADWGWRIPFLLSAVLVIISIYIRLQMQESPVFTKLKSEGKTSTNPLKESFANKANLKMVLLALFGVTMGQGVIWYTGQFYAQSFIETVCKVNFEDSRTVIMWAIVFATPLFVFFGGLSDKVGRKWIMILGILLGACSYHFIYGQFLSLTDPAAKRNIVDASKTTATPKVATLDAKDKTKLFIVSKFDSAYTDGALYKFTKTDTVKLNQEFTRATTVTNADTLFAFIMPTKEDQPADTSFIKLKSLAKEAPSKTDTVFADVVMKSSMPNVAIEKSLDSHSYWMIVLLVFVQIAFAAMAYGPIAAFLVELFPTRIRYTSMSLPYHIGNGVFGGLVPFLSTLIVAYSGHPLAGLLYPMITAGICFVIGALYLSPKTNKDIFDEVNANAN